MLFDGTISYVIVFITQIFSFEIYILHYDVFLFFILFESIKNVKSSFT